MRLLDIFPNLPNWALYLIIGGVVGLLFLIWIKRAKPSGVMGGRTELNLYALDSKKYKVLRNFKYAVKDKIVSVNYVIISIYGIFVCDYLNLKGVIKGNDAKPEWENIVRNDYGAKSEQSIINPYIKLEESVKLLKKDSTFKSELLIPTLVLGEYMDTDLVGDKLKVRINNVEKDISIFKKPAMTEDKMNKLYEELKGELDDQY